MDWNTPDLNSWPAKLVLRVGKKMRSNKQFTQKAIEKNNAKEAERRQQRRLAHATKNHYLAKDSSEQARPSNEVNELGERDYSAISEASTLVEQKDHTDMMHRLAHHDSFDSLVDRLVDHEKLKDPYFDCERHAEDLARISTRHERMVETLSDEVWQQISSWLSPLDSAQLALSSRTLLAKLGPEPFIALNRPEHRTYKISFLQSEDGKLPRHLFCFPCAKYHLRLRPGSESLKADYVANPVFDCPAAKASVLPRIRISHGRELPYSFLQLALRESNCSRAHGISHEQLARRWKNADSGWSYRSRYMVHDSRLLMRVVSQRFAPPAATLTKTAERHVLYDREEYTPFFSVCAHWQDGDLMDICKCALSHVPAPPQSYHEQIKKSPHISKTLARPDFLVRGCDWCRPARRCPECPTEYLVEIQMTEDLADPVHPFKHAIVVTRWSDLGDGSSPYTSPEWTAVKGHQVEGDGYGSFAHVGRRAVSGVFESRISGSIPGQRMLSLNPKNKKLGEDGHGWY